MVPHRPLPVTVVGGYLGAGKTTMINHLLRHADGVRLAVLVNDFGELPIDADLIESQDDNVISITGGCVCCSYGSDLMEALIDLDQLDSAPDHLLIETSGVGLPNAIAQSVQLLAQYVVDGIVVLADGETVRERGEDRYLHDTIGRQLAAADAVILNKVDLLSGQALQETRDWIDAKTGDVPIIETAQAAVSMSALTGAGLDRLIQEDVAPAHIHADHEAAVIEINRRLDPEALAQQLAAPALNLIRVKGFVPDRDGRLCTIQSVGSRWTIGDASPTTDPSGRIVCITHKPPIDRDGINRAIALIE